MTITIERVTLDAMKHPASSQVHEVTITTGFLQDHGVRCTCGLDRRGFNHKARAEMFGQRHIVEQSALDETQFTTI